jgi:hypothetical protein
MSWLVLLVSMPPAPARDRVGVWRKLKRIGAVPFKGAAWILPEFPETTELFQWLLQEVQSLGGEAALIRTERLDPLSGKEVAALFHSQRGADYAAVVRACAALRKDLSGKGGKTPAALARLRTRLAAIKRDLDRIGRMDYLHAPAGDAALAAYEGVSRIVHAIAEPAMTVKAPKRKGPAGLPPPGSTWVTRTRPHIDRVGSAWLIARFHDAKARFVFAQDPLSVRNAVPFDVLGAEFGHHGEDCSFETILKRLKVKDARLCAIAEIVHEADLRDGKFPRAEAPGLDLTIKGLAATGRSDPALLEAGLAVFDGLYAALKPAARSQGAGRPRTRRA